MQAQQSLHRDLMQLNETQKKHFSIQILCSLLESLPFVQHTEQPYHELLQSYNQLLINKRTNIK